MFEITHLEKKESKKLEYFPLDDNTYLVEYPYLSNTESTQNIANTLNMQHILNICQNSKMILLLNGPDLSLERGSPMIEFLTRFLRITSQSVL